MYPDDISPPESVNGKSQKCSPDVSPIEPPRALAVRAQKGDHNERSGSGIPLPKKPTYGGGRGIPMTGRRIRGASLPIRSSSSTISTQWDEISGEPTTNERNKIVRTDQGAVSSEPFYTYRRDISTNQISNIETGSQGRRTLSSQRADHVFSPKEGWKGASGRHTIINPLLDKPLPPGQSPAFPAGVRNSLEKPRRKSFDRQPPSSAVHHATQRDPDRTAPSKQTASLDFVDTSFGSFTGPTTPIASQKSTQAVHSAPKPSYDNRPITKGSEDIEEEHNFYVAPLRTNSNSNLEAHEISQAENEFRAKMHKMHLEDQPPSRFSSTTYATTTYDSPPVTPNMSSESPIPKTPSPILNRRRPVPTTGPGGKVAARKPTPSDLEKSAVAKSKEKNFKSLPLSPPEAQAVTRMASLEAKLDNLRRRRYNLKTVIHELTNVVQPSSIAYDMASRQEIKKTVDGLNTELSEVNKDEHETGLQLHRAWKREEETSTFEISSLWVRRLAS